MTREQAIEQPLNVWIVWCYNYVNSRASENPAIAGMFESLNGRGGASVFQMLWTKQYWMHHASKVG